MCFVVSGFMLIWGLCGDEIEVGDKFEVRDFFVLFDIFLLLLGISIIGIGVVLVDDVMVLVFGFWCVVCFGLIMFGSFEFDFLLEFSFLFK